MIDNETSLAGVIEVADQDATASQCGKSNQGDWLLIYTVVNHMAETYCDALRGFMAWQHVIIQMKR